MTFKPAHKDTENPPGQIRNELTIADYIERKGYTQPKKLTFDEWWNSTRLKINYEYMKSVYQDCWKAGQENK